MQLPAHDYLDERNIPYERLTFSTDTPKTAQAVADALGYEPGQMVKTLIFEAGTGEHVLVMIAADQNAISGLLKKAIGNRNIKMAKPDVVLEVTGYEIGSIPPFCWQPQGFRSFIEKSLLQYDVLGVGAGVRGQEIMISPDDLIKACDGIVVNLTDREQPVYEG